LNGVGVEIDVAADLCQCDVLPSNFDCHIEAVESWFPDALFFDAGYRVACRVDVPARWWWVSRVGCGWAEDVGRSRNNKCLSDRRPVRSVASLPVIKVLSALVGNINPLIITLLVRIGLMTELMIWPRLQFTDSIVRCPVCRNAVVRRLDDIELFDDKNVLRSGSDWDSPWGE